MNVGDTHNELKFSHIYGDRMYTFGTKVPLFGFVRGLPHFWEYAIHYPSAKLPRHKELENLAI